MSEESFDSLVMGGGVMGYSAAYHLAMVGERTALVEQFSSPNTRGSSTGETRITRIANYSTPALTPIMVNALGRWKEMQQLTGQQLFTPSLMLCVGQGALMERCSESMVEGGATPSHSTPQQVNSKYGTNFTGDLTCFFDEDAGILNARRCMLSLKDLFLKHQGRVFDNTKVSSIEPGAKVRITTANGRVLTAKRLVICCGSWTQKILSDLGLQLPLQAIRVPVLYWKVKNPNFSPPVFIFREEKLFYGLPEGEYPGLAKVSPHVGLPCDPDERDLTNIDSVVAEAKAFVTTYLPCLEPQPSVVESCMYTMTPDEEMILDSVPGFPNIVYGCGFSGSGFKIGPTVGDILCRMVTGRQQQFDISYFGAQRFKKMASL